MTVIDVIGKDRALDEINRSLYRDHEILDGKLRTVDAAYGLHSRLEQMVEFTYSVSMCATSDTYVYGIYRFDGSHMLLVELTLEEVRRLYPTLRNNADALVWLNANAASAFDYGIPLTIY